MKQGERKGCSCHDPSQSLAYRARSLSRAGAALCAALSLALAADLVGCSSSPSKEEPRIDMTTDETAKASLDKVNESLTKEQRRELAKATGELVQHEMAANPELTKDPIKMRALLVRLLDGKTAAQLIAEAKTLPKPAKGAPAAAPNGAG